MQQLMTVGTCGVGGAKLEDERNAVTREGIELL
jgi:hypothetical protein